LRKARSSLALAAQELQYAEKSGLSQQQTELELAAHQARVRATQARQEHERLARLLGKSLISEKAATEARQAAETSQREAAGAEKKAADYGQSGKQLDRARLRDKLEEARSALRLAELQVEALTVRAPLAGRVGRVNAAVGQSVDKGALLVELQANEGARALFALAPVQASRVRPGMAFRLEDAPSARAFQGTILAVGGGVDAETGLVRVEGALDAGDGPAPYLGEILQGEIITGASPPGLLVPLGSLSLTDEGAFVHQVDDKNQARLTAVEVLARGAESAVIRGPGLKSGARVIVEGNYNLPDGATVVAEREP
jgi:RND family efflux transporter MFP subunit